MPIFMDRHELAGVTAEVLAGLHAMDLEVQERVGAKILTYWFDEARGAGFCLIEAPDRATAVRVHAESHGNLAVDMIAVELSAVEAFLGRIADPAMQTPDGAAAVDSAFRAVMFTDIVESTAMTERLGDTRSVEMVRTHDSLVRRALRDAAGHEVKHTGDGIMASFEDVVAAVDCTCTIQRSFADFNRDSGEKLHVRIGVHCGEPVQDSNDLFGSTVQMAARLCQRAGTDAIVVSDAVHQELPRRVSLSALGPQSLKGFAEPVELYQVEWRGA
ncbi:MAG TPA: nickel-binding protein [Devosiaceae bacterium]|nr:nickel-binding protein [Devosiaceae bacterium]